MILSMKLSISVPDDLWTSVSAKTGGGPSDTVQLALRALAKVQRAEERPLAHAPYPSDEFQYLDSFEGAVGNAVDSILVVKDFGYHFGLRAGRGLQSEDIDALSKPGAFKEFKAQVSLPEEPAADRELPGESPSLFSGYFLDWLHALLHPGEDEIIREEFPEGIDLDRLHPANRAGRRWSGIWWNEDGSAATLSDTCAKSAFEALLDIRDEALRRVARAKSDEGRAQ
jgi:hypothetical protein